MKNKILILLIISFGISAAHADSEKEPWRKILTERLQHFSQPLNLKSLQEKNSIEYFYEILNPEAYQYKSEMSNDVNAGSASDAWEKLRFLDFTNVWSEYQSEINRGRSETLYPQIGKIAFVVKKPIGFFSRERSLDPDFMNSLSDKMMMTQISNGVYRADSRAKWVPSGEFKVHYIKNTFNLGVDDLHWIQFLTALDPALGRPNSLVLQNGYNFQKVSLRFHGVTMYSTDACKAVFTASLHYAIDDATTLVVTYTLTFVQNLPPKMHNRFVQSEGRDQLRIDGLVGTQYLVNALRK
jgi:hypothetical protein